MERQYWWTVDLLVAAALTLLAGAVALSGLGGIVRMIALAPLVLFLPGYGVVCAAYPRAANDYGTFDADTTGISAPTWVPDGLGGVERAVVSVVASIALVPFVTLVVTALALPIQTLIVLAGVVALTLLALVAAFARRAQVPAEERFAVSAAPMWFRSSGRGPLGGGGGSARRYNAAIVVSLLLLAASAGVAAVVPPRDSGYTELYVTNVTVSGDATPAFPTTMTQGETATLPVTVGNHEGHDQQYTLVTTMHADDGSRELHRRQVSVPAGETRNVTVPVTPQRSGDGLEVRVLLYRESAPGDPTLEGAYRALRLPIDFVRTARNG